MSGQVPTLEEAVETEETSGDGFWAGWLVAAGGVAGPAAEAAHDPGKPSQARWRVRVLQFYGMARPSLPTAWADRRQPEERKHVTADRSSRDRSREEQLQRRRPG